MTAPAQAWEEVYRAESARLWRALLAYSRSPDVASEAVSEAFTQAIARSDGIRDPASWVWTVAFRTAAGELKRRRSWGSFEDDGRSYELPDAMPELLDALRRLSSNQRAAVVLHDYADRPTDEIARTLSMRVPTVYVHLSQGRRRLRALLEQDDG